MCVGVGGEREREEGTLRNWFMRPWRLESVKSAEQAGKLEYQGRVNTDCSVSLKAVCWQNPLFLRGG